MSRRCEMENFVRASIIIPTYNRAGYLAKCLDALVLLNTDPMLFEILVIDNNSTDDTCKVVRDFATAHPNLLVRYVMEEKQGVSRARNRALAEARGEILYFLDDDSPPIPEWLNYLEAAFDDPQVGCAGGPSVLDFQGQPVPPWLRGDMQGLISGYGLPFDKPTPLSRWDQFPLSCNMALRKEAIAHLDAFRDDLGRIGSVKLTGGETEMINRIHKSGWKIIYVPKAIVHHMVSPERLEKAYLYKIGYGHAASHIVLTSDPRPLMILRWFAIDGWYATRRFFWLIISLLQRKPLWFDDYMRFWVVAMRIPLRMKVTWQHLRTNGN